MNKKVCVCVCVFVQEIAEEGEGGEGEAVQRQQSAVQRATKVLLNRHSAPTALVLTYLPWLISTSPKHALSVLKVWTRCRFCHRCSQYRIHAALLD